MYTLINGWTKESLIAHVKKNFKGRSTDSRGNCKYRGPDGRKCAVGVFIPDSIYDTDMEGRSMVAIQDVFPLKSVIPISNEGMMQLQLQHDDAYDNYMQNDGRILSTTSLTIDEFTLDSMLSWIRKHVVDPKVKKATPKSKVSLRKKK